MLDKPLLISPEICARLQRVRVGRLATVDPQQKPHVIPICFVWDGSVFYSAIDNKHPSDSARCATFVMASVVADRANVGKGKTIFMAASEAEMAAI